MQDRKAEKRLFEYNDIIKENDNIYRGVAKRFGLSECAFWIVYALRAEREILTQSEICEVLYQPKQTIHSALKNLEAEGYIELSFGRDRRAKHVKLTEKGAALAERTVDRVLAAERNALLALTEVEQKTFLALFRKYTAALREQVGGEVKHENTII